MSSRVTNTSNRWQQHNGPETTPLDLQGVEPWNQVNQCYQHVCSNLGRVTTASNRWPRPNEHNGPSPWTYKEAAKPSEPVNEQESSPAENWLEIRISWVYIAILLRSDWLKFVALQSNRFHSNQIKKLTTSVLENDKLHPKKIRSWSDHLNNEIRNVHLKDIWSNNNKFFYKNWTNL